MKSVIRAVLIWLALVFLFGLLGMRLLNWSSYRHLAASAVRTTGHVTAKEPENHQFVRYSFDVENRSYSGFGNAGGENPEFEQLKVGDPVNVYYDPQNPNESFLGDPRKQSDSLTTGLVVIAFGGASLSLLALYWKGWLPVSQTSSSRDTHTG